MRHRFLLLPLLLSLQAGRVASDPGTGTRLPADNSAPEGATISPPPSCWAPCPNPRWVFKAIVPGRTQDGVNGAAAGIGDGRIYVSHGRIPGDVPELRIYDIASDSWSLAANAAVPRADLVGAVVGTRYYVIGGTLADGPSDDVEVYDTLTGTWGRGSPMPTSRATMGLAVLDGKLHLIGGTEYGLSRGWPLDTHEVYDPDTDSWSSRAPLPVALGSTTSTVALDGRVYVFGGSSGAGTDFNHIYDPAGDSWTAGAPLPNPKRFDAAAAVMKGRIVVIGGNRNFEPIDDVDV